jgi:hypothetical protein
MKRNEWKPWIRLLLEKEQFYVPTAGLYGLRGFLTQYKKDSLRWVIAAALSVAKWHPENSERGLGHCGLCQMDVLLTKPPDNTTECTNCPYCKMFGDCSAPSRLCQTLRAAQR